MERGITDEKEIKEGHFEGGEKENDDSEISEQEHLSSDVTSEHLLSYHEIESMMLLYGTMIKVLSKNREQRWRQEFLHILNYLALMQQILVNVRVQKANQENNERVNGPKNTIDRVSRQRADNSNAGRNVPFFVA